MLKKIIQSYIKSTIETSSIEDIEKSAYPIIALPFNGSIHYFKVKCLNDTQVKACGEFSLIDISDSKKTIVKNPTEYLKSLVKIKNFQERLAQETLIEPTFADMEKKIYKNDESLKDKLKKIDELSEKIKHIPVEEQTLYIKEIDELELFSGYLFPTDFMDSLTTWALGTDRSDIKKITRDMLLESAILAERGHDNPCEHIKGNFTPLHNEEINKAAWCVYGQYQEDKEKEKTSGKTHRVIRGKGG